MTDTAPPPSPSESDARAEQLALVTAAQQGDCAAFADLIGRYERLVYKIALGKTRNRADADDLSQEICLHAFRSLPSLRDPAAFVSWLMSVAYNRANRFCRTRQRKIVALEEARIELAERAKRRAAPPPEDGSAELVRNLSEEYRLALTWKYIDGCSYEEIGERLNMSFHQVDYLLRKAKRALRVVVEKSGAAAEGRRS